MMGVTRRGFLRTLGGSGVVLAAGALGLTQCDRMPAQAVAAWTGPAATLTDARERALAWALLAPNPHNIQPWLADLRQDGQILLHVDPARLLPETDPFGRQIVIGHGTFLEILAMALAEEGYQADIVPWPNGEPTGLADLHTRPVAVITIRPAPGLPRDPLFAQVHLRRSIKEPYDMARPVTEAQAARLSQAAGAGVTTEFALDGARAETLITLTREAMLTEIMTPRTLKESVDLTRIGAAEIARHRDGIDLHGPMFWWLKQLGMMDPADALTPGTPAHQGGIDYALGWANGTRSFGWIATPGNGRGDQIAAGRAYLRLCLAATEAGIAVHPVSQLLQEYPEMAELQARFLALAAPAPGTSVQMLYRLGYAAATPPSPRRELASILRA